MRKLDLFNEGYTCTMKKGEMSFILQNFKR